jgi:1-aminocyclopropane-1-carboxylate deaminase/D-cysteine desulfhydrase-like pyridoxal-dependent ACC family enzyme
MRDLDSLRRAKLANTPTPLEDAPRLAAALGLKRLLVKRDDLTGLALGGNKPRKLEFVIGEALAQGADVLITSTGPQSNRARMTAAACRRAGLDCILLFAGDYGSKMPVGNIMLDEVLGAEIRFIEAPDSYSPLALREANKIAESLRRAGRRPYLTEVGGQSDPIATLGYYLGGLELIEQCRRQNAEPGCILLATGSGGTQAGMLVATRARDCAAQVIGISTDPGAAKRARRVQQHAEDMIAWLGNITKIVPDDVIVDDRYSAAGHGAPDSMSIAAVRLAARCEGLLLDPIYVGKVVAAVPQLVTERLIDPDQPVVLVNTGGIVSLFMHTDVFVQSADPMVFAA